MQKITFLVGLLVLAFSACNCRGVQYEIDGVPIILEEGSGPSRDHMLLCAEKYRMEAGLRWNLMPEDETAVWRALSEIRWTVEVTPGGAYYKPEGRNIRAMWKFCPLNVPLYPVLTEHYVAVLQDGQEPSDDDQEWARDLQEVAKPALCVLDI